MTAPFPTKTKCEHDWCMPLKIDFTDKGKSQDWTIRGFEWGLRMRKCDSITLSCRDPGLTFKIKLLKEIPNKNAAAIGSNPQLLPPPKLPIPSKPPYHHL